MDTQSREQIEREIETYENRREQKIRYLKCLVVIASALICLNICLCIVSIVRLIPIKAIEYNNSDEILLFFVFSFLNLINCIALIIFAIGVRYWKYNYIIASMLINSIWIFVAICTYAVIFAVPGLYHHNARGSERCTIHINLFQAFCRTVHT